MNDEVKPVIVVSTDDGKRIAIRAEVDAEPEDWKALVVIRCGVRNDAGDRCRRPLVELFHHSQNGWTFAESFTKPTASSQGRRTRCGYSTAPLTARRRACHLVNMLADIEHYFRTHDEECEQFRRSGKVEAVRVGVKSCQRVMPSWHYVPAG